MPTTSAKRLKWINYIPHKPTPKQLQALMSDSKELLFGGALGGGKSDFLLMSCLQYLDVPGYASGIFRKQLTDLKQPGALLDRAKEWLDPWKKHGVKYVPGEHTYYFPTTMPDGSKGADAKLVFCYVGDVNAKDRYQSSEYQTIAFDEISQWETPGDYEFMTTRLRRTTCKAHGKKSDGTPNWVKGCPECELKRSIPVRIRAATNPGGLGGNWIKKRFQIIPDPKVYPDRRDAITAATSGIRVPFVGTHPQREFVPSYIDDNPHLDLTDYSEFLDNLEPELKAQLKDGNWEARADSRFKRNWVRYFEVHPFGIRLGYQMFPFSHFQKMFATIDYASTAKEGIIDNQVHRKAPSFSVMCVWGETKEKDLFLLDCWRDRCEVPVIVEEAVKVWARWQEWGIKYLKSETNGVGSGPTQYLQRLGIPIKKVVKGSDKLENSTSAMLLMKGGKVYFPINAPFIYDVEDEVFSWIGLPAETDDIIDNLSDAANELGAVADALANKTEAHQIKSTFLHVPMIRNKSPQLAIGTRKRHPLLPRKL